MPSKVPDQSKNIYRIKRYANSLVGLIEKSSLTQKELYKINKEVNRFFRLINETDLRKLSKTELLQLDDIFVSFDNALSKRSLSLDNYLLKAQAFGVKEAPHPGKSLQEVPPRSSVEDYLRSRTLKSLLKGNPVYALTFESKDSFTDQEGIKRDVYNFRLPTGKQLSVVFYPKNALPFNKELTEGKDIILFGSQPKSRSEEKWTDFLNKVKENSANFKDVNNLAELNKDTVAFVEIDPFQIAKLAKSLGSTDELVDKLIKWGESKDWRIPKDIYPAIDMLIAGMVVDQEGRLTAERSTDAANLLFKSFLGDGEARKILQDKVNALTEIISNWEEENITFNRYMNLKKAGLFYTDLLDKIEFNLEVHISTLLEKFYPEESKLERIKQLDIDGISDLEKKISDRLTELDNSLLSLKAAFDKMQEELKAKLSEKEENKANKLKSIFKHDKTEKLEQEISTTEKKLSSINTEILAKGSEKATLDDAAKALDDLRTVKIWRSKIRNIDISKYDPTDETKAVVNDVDLVRKLADIVRNTILSKEELRFPTLEKLVSVHATQFYPSEGLDGTKVIVPLFDATNNQIQRKGIITSEYLKKPLVFPVPRNTIHFAENSVAAPTKVDINVGDWQNMPFAIIVPTKSLIESNGKPFSIAYHDTIFRASPGEGIKLPPDAVIVRPMTDEEKKSSEPVLILNKNEIAYNPDEITKEKVVFDWLKENGYPTLEYDADGYGDRFNILMAGYELGVTIEKDASLLNQALVTKPVYNVFNNLKNDTITMLEFEKTRNEILEDIFNASNNVEEKFGYASWAEFRALYLAGVL